MTGTGRSYSFFSIEDESENDGYKDVVFIQTHNALARAFEHAAYSDDDSIPTNIWTAIDGKPVECEFEVPKGPPAWDENDRATVTVRIRRKDDGQVLDAFFYSLDGRA